jgi:hypothetical protein
VERAPLETFDQPVYIGTDQVDNRVDIDCFLHHARLMHVARNSIQDQRIAFGAKLSGSDTAVDAVPPKPDGSFVWNELAAARILDKDAAQVVVGPQIPEDIATSAVKELRNSPKDLALSPLPCAGSAEK